MENMKPVLLMALLFVANKLTALIFTFPEHTGMTAFIVNGIFTLGIYWCGSKIINKYSKGK